MRRYLYVYIIYNLFLRYLYNLLPERATARMQENVLREWLTDALLSCGGDKIPLIAENLDRSRCFSRYALASANPEDLKRFGIKGDDIDKVQIKATQELPDLEYAVLEKQQQEVYDTEAKALTQRANTLMLTPKDDFQFDFGGAHDATDDRTGELNVDKTGIDIGPQTLSKLNESTHARSRANTNIRAYHKGR